VCTEGENDSEEEARYSETEIGGGRKSLVLWISLGAAAEVSIIFKRSKKQLDALE